ncbi:MAG: hypothetical protein JW787_08455 [Sedimentisphaerales bacterium]|nr:hypothetical protein [Sedimentisphaerales bacterium]
MKEPDYSKYITILLAVLGIILSFYSAILGTIVIVLSFISLAFWFVYQRLEKIEKDIEMTNNHSIKNDERLHNIEQFIKKFESDEAS